MQACTKTYYFITAHRSEVSVLADRIGMRMKESRVTDIPKVGVFPNIKVKVVIFGHWMTFYARETFIKQVIS